MLGQVGRQHRVSVAECAIELLADRPGAEHLAQLAGRQPVLNAVLERRAAIGRRLEAVHMVPRGEWTRTCVSQNCRPGW